MLIEIDETLARKIFEAKQLEYCIEDVKIRLEEILSEEESNDLNAAVEKFNENDYRSIAQNFLDNHDCNQSDNEQYRTAIMDYLEAALL